MLLTIPFFFYGKDIFISGFKNLIHKTPNMDTLVSIGVIASFIYSIFGTVMIFFNHYEYVHHLYFESSTTIIYFLKLGRFIDQKRKEKTGSAIKELVKMTPTSALLKTKDGEKEISIDEVQIDDILIAKPGMKIAVDGVITNGTTHIEVTNTKAPIAHLADRVSLYFVPTIIVLATITFFLSLCFKIPFYEALTSFVNALVVACPCSLGLAMPLAMVVSVGTCAKQGILIKQSKTLEIAHKINTVVFDKTGTLTYGNMKLSKMALFHKYSKQEVLKYVASLEKNSNHPIAKAFLKEAEEQQIVLEEVQDFKSLSGIGLSGKIENKTIFVGNRQLFSMLDIQNDYEKKEAELSKFGSIVYVVLDKKVIALICVGDIVRENSKATISKLQQLHKEVILLTGDHLESAQKIATEIGIKNIKANVLPTEKESTIQTLMKKGKW